MGRALRATEYWLACGRCFALMRYQGKISAWKDEQGFGFVSPNGGGQKAFVHIKAFLRRSPRPVDGDLITYELAKDKRNRYYAKNIQLVGESSMSLEHHKSSLIPSFFAILFLVLLFLLTLNKLVPLNLFVAYLCVSAVTFIVYAKDKLAAKNNRQRTPENILHLLSFIAGWPGAIFAQKIFRHKSKKEAFQNIFWLTVFLNFSAIAWLLLSDSGKNFINAFT